MGVHVRGELTRLCRKSVHGSTGSPRTDHDIIQVNHRAARPERGPIGSDVEGPEQRITVQALHGEKEYGMIDWAKIHDQKSFSAMTPALACFSFLYGAAVRLRVKAYPIKRKILCPDLS